MAKNKDSTVWAFLGVFLGLIGFLLVYFIRKDDKVAMYYGKIGLVVTILYVIFAVISIIPFIGIIATIGILIVFIGWIVAFIAALSGEKKRIPVLSDLADKIKI